MNMEQDQGTAGKTHPRRLRVFIVDDDRDLAESLALAVEGRGYEVEVAHSGEEAIERYRQRDFDIAFMDVRLPGKNGVESFLEIRDIRPEARVVMITGYLMEELRQQAEEHGVQGVLQKPFSPRRLFDILERLRDEGTP